MIACRECGKEFNSRRGLHGHLKAHKMKQKQYYELHEPRTTKDGNPVKFKKTYDQYISADFNSMGDRDRWLTSADNEFEAKVYLVQLLIDYAKDKDTEFAPCQVELVTHRLPDVLFFESLFGSYERACEAAGLTPKLSTKKPNVTQPSNPLVFIDSREQKPLPFKNSMVQKLDFGDYTFGDDNYCGIYAERKSGNDYNVTMSSGYERLIKEVERAVAMDCFVFIVVESSFDKLVKYNGKFGAPQAKLDLIFYRTRELIRNYQGHIQFLFTGGRKKSREYIPLLLANPSLKDVDVQYLFDRGEL